MNKTDFTKCLNTVENFINEHSEYDVHRSSLNLAHLFSEGELNEGTIQNLIKVFKEGENQIFALSYENYMINEKEDYLVNLTYNETNIKNIKVDLFNLIFENLIK